MLKAVSKILSHFLSELVFAPLQLIVCNKKLHEPNIEISWADIVNVLLLEYIVTVAIV